MPQSQAHVSDDICQVLVESYAVNERMFQIVLENLDPAAWRAQQPGSRGRTIADVVVHVHNMRRKWLRLSAPHLKSPAPLDRVRCTQEQARTALAQSAAGCAEMLAEAIVQPKGKVETFLRDGWAKPWPAGAAMLVYMVTHDAHHRGQVCMLAHQLGFPLPQKVTAEMWSWERLWKKCGFAHPR
jgi:uncharacterized damage-inducible protein DinB